MKTTYDSGFKQECATVGCENFVGLPEGVQTDVHCLDRITVPEFHPNGHFKGLVSIPIGCTMGDRYNVPGKKVYSYKFKEGRMHFVVNHSGPEREARDFPSRTLVLGIYEKHLP